MSQTLIIKQKPKTECVFRVKRTRYGTEIYIKSPLAEKIFAQVLKASVAPKLWNNKNYYDYGSVVHSFSDFFNSKVFGFFVEYKENIRVPNLIFLALVGIGNGITIKYSRPINIEAIRHFETEFQKAATSFLFFYKKQCDCYE
jgi:hypothetical protein